MKKHFLLSVFFFSFFQDLQAQNTSIGNIFDFKPQNAIAIKNNKQIVGYVLFYQLESNSSAASYAFKILDENLKTIGNNEFEGTPGLFLTKAIFESDRLFLLFKEFDPKNDFPSFVKVYSLNGKLLNTIEYENAYVDKSKTSSRVASNLSRYYEGFENVEGKGVVNVRQSLDKEGGVDVEFINVAGKRKWAKNYISDGNRTDMYLVATSPTALVFFQFSRESIRDRDAETFLIGYNPETGKQIFKKSTTIKNYVYEPILIKPSKKDSSYIIVSNLTDPNEDFVKAKVLGISIGNLDMRTGAITNSKSIMLDKGLSNLKLDEINDKNNNYYTVIHDVIFLENDEMIIVGEFAKRVVSVGGVILKLVSRGAGQASHGVVEDLFLIRLDGKKEIKKIEIIEKEKESIHTISDGLSIALFLKYLKMEDLMGYQYTDEGMEGEDISLLVKGKFNKESYGISSINIDKKSGFTIKKLTLPEDKNESVRIMQGKPGYVMVIKYNKKKKTLSLSQEKIN